MDAIERAIRNALEKGNADDRVFRERVYRAAYTSLQRAMEGNPRIDEQGAARRRELFKRHVVSIEREYMPAIEPEQAAPDAGPVAAPETANPPADAAPAVPAPERRQAARVPSPSLDMAPDERRPAPPTREPAPLSAPPGDRIDAVPPRAGRRPYGLILAVVAVLAALAIGLWWFAPLLSGAGGAGSNPPAAAEGESFTPGDDGEPTLPGTEVLSWIDVFQPTDPASIRAPGGTSAEVADDAGEAFLRIRSTSDGAAIGFDIGEGTLQRLAGKTAIFSIDARSEEQRETQISIACNFAGLGDCGRRRYLLAAERGEYLFEVAIPAGTPSGAGSIEIVPDVANQGRPVDIFAIRVAVQ